MVVREHMNVSEVNATAPIGFQLESVKTLDLNVYTYQPWPNVQVNLVDNDGNEAVALLSLEKILKKQRLVLTATQMKLTLQFQWQNLPPGITTGRDTAIDLRNVFLNRLHASRELQKWYNTHSKRKDKIRMYHCFGVLPPGKISEKI